MYFLSLSRSAEVPFSVIRYTHLRISTSAWEQNPLHFQGKSLKILQYIVDSVLYLRLFWYRDDPTLWHDVPIFCNDTSLGRSFPRTKRTMADVTLWHNDPIFMTAHINKNNRNSTIFKTNNPSRSWSFGWKICLYIYCKHFLVVY
jgi:hypothetical protein